MAAKAIKIQTSNSRKSSKSKRVRAANKFLSNISLDGSISKDNTKKEPAKSRTKYRPTLDKDEEEILSNPNFLDPSFQQRPKLLASFSTTNALKDEENVDPTGSASCATAFRKDSYIERNYHRTASLSMRAESTLLHNNLTFTSSKTLLKYQEQLRGKRILLCSGHYVPFAVYSTLKYSQQEHGDLLDKNAHRLRRMSGGHGCDIYGIKGVDLGPQNKPVSFGHLLEPTCSLSSSTRTYNITPRKNTAAMLSLTFPEPRSPIFQSANESNIINIASCSHDQGKVLAPRGDHFMVSHVEQTSSFEIYDPLSLDDPELRTGRHRTVLRLSSFMVSIIEYVRPSQLKKDLNEQFREKFPNMEITLSKLRSLKEDLVRLSMECLLDRSTVAYSFVYFEKLVLGEKINKVNRKLVAGSCMLLAAKFNNDLRKDSVKHLIDVICDLLRVNVDNLFLFEIQALIALEFNLHLPSTQLIPHMKRLEFGTTSFI